MKPAGSIAGPCRWLAGFLLASLAVQASPPAVPLIRHVFIVVLENQDYEASFGPASPAAYLKSLRQRGVSVPNYYGTSHFSLGNYLTLISGQAPNPATNEDCEIFEEFISSGTTPDGQAIGKGCVYPANIQTLANQLDRAHLTWKAYMEDMGNNPRRESATCGHPAIGTRDPTQAAEVGDQYATRHNPFVYFHAIIDTPGCARNVVSLKELAADLRSAKSTPNYLFITPNLCHDGHDGGGSARCVNGEPGGLVSADTFLRQLVPQILASAAYRRDGLLIVTFDESGMAETYDDAGNVVSMAAGAAAACCNEPSGPNIRPYQADPALATPGMNGPGMMGPGGGRIGAVLLSPFIRPGTVTTTDYNHYSLLRSIEDIFGLKHLGFAAQPGLKSFGADIFNRPRQGMRQAAACRAPARPCAADPGDR